MLSLHGSLLYLFHIHIKNLLRNRYFGGGGRGRAGGGGQGKASK